MGSNERKLSAKLASTAVAGQDGRNSTPSLLVLRITNDRFMLPAMSATPSVLE
jgi:hypothetical protein